MANATNDFRTAIDARMAREYAPLCDKLASPWGVRGCIDRWLRGRRCEWPQGLAVLAAQQAVALGACDADANKAQAAMSDFKTRVRACLKQRFDGLPPTSRKSWATRAIAQEGWVSAQVSTQLGRLHVFGDSDTLMLGLRAQRWNERHVRQGVCESMALLLVLEAAQDVSRGARPRRPWH